MNGAAIIAAVRATTLLDTDQVTDDEMLVWVNEGHFRLAALHSWPWLQAAGHFHSAGAVQAYPITDIDATARRIVAIYDDTTSRRVRQVSATNAIETYGNDFPTAALATCYFLWGGSIYLIPIPTVVATYRVLYYKAPTAISTITSPEFDTQFHGALVHYGEFRVWEREEDLEKAGASYAHYLDMVGRMNAWYGQQAEDNPWAVGQPVASARWTNTPFLDGL